MERVNLSISGMTCGHCVGQVEKALKAVDGVAVEHITLGSAVVSIDPAKALTSKLVQAVADAGYEVTSTNAA